MNLHYFQIDSTCILSIDLITVSSFEPILKSGRLGPLESYRGLAVTLRTTHRWIVPQFLNLRPKMAKYIVYVITLITNRNHAFHCSQTGTMLSIV